MKRWRRVAVVLAVAGMLAIAVVVWRALLPAAHTAPPPAVSFEASRAWHDLEQQVAFGYRVPGSAAHRATRDWLVAQLTPLAKSVTLQPFDHPLGGREVAMCNIIAEFPGTGPAPRERVLLAAHWDTRPTADKDHDPAKRNTPIAGANDGASGVAVLLEVARQLKAHPIARDVVVVLFDGEDYGPAIDDMLLGSQHYARELAAPRPDWGILLDMVGDANLDIYREPNSEKYARHVNDRVFAAARALGCLRTMRQGGFVDKLYRYPIYDDHMPLNLVGVPMVDLIDFNYPYWHTTQDTPERCSANSLAIVGKTVLLAIR